MNQEQRIYWNSRFETGKYIWGDKPSSSCILVENYFRKDELKKILVGGCGYGRHTEYFASKGYTTSGLDISDMAIDNARKSASMKDLDIKYYNSDIQDFKTDEIYDGFFAFSLLHLIYLDKERFQIYESLKRIIKKDGRIFISVMSVNDPFYGCGKQLEEDVFEGKPGRAVRFFSKDSLREDLEGYFSIIEILDIDEPEEHGGSKHIHKQVAAYCKV